MRCGVSKLQLASLRHIYTSPKLIKVIKPLGLQWVVNLLQSILEHACDLVTPRVHSQETNLLFLAYHVGDRYESSRTYGMIIDN
jgi:hypothetical protein